MENAESIDNDAESHVDINSVKAIVTKHFPFPSCLEGVLAGLSAFASLLLDDIKNCTALIYVGPPSAGKTTIAEMFTGVKELVYVSDDFTSAAFVSGAAQKSAEELSKIDLLPKIKHKVLITPELAPIFRGKEVELLQMFSTITRVLDGDGFCRDTGTQGGRGYRGDYTFAWLGCTTPFDRTAWKVMNQLGSRLFFLVLETEGAEDEQSLLAELAGPTAYAFRRDECREVVSGFIRHLFQSSGGVRGVRWERSLDNNEAHKWIVRAGRLLAKTRGHRMGSDSEDPISAESPTRAVQVFYNFARGHALIHGRRVVTMEDIPLVVRIAASSMPTERSRVFKKLVNSGNGRLTTDEVRLALGAKSESPAQTAMADLAHLGIVNYQRGTKGAGCAGTICFNAEWEWCASSEFKGMLTAHVINAENRGVCVSSENAEI